MSPVDRLTQELKNTLAADYRNCQNFIDKLRRECEPLFMKIDQHPFLVEVEAGKLPLEKYKTYATQNFYYFNEWFRCCAAAAAKAPTIAETRKYTKWMTNTNPEYDKFVALIKAVGISDKQLAEITVNPAIPLPAARAYIDYQFKIYSTTSAGEMAAAILPCAWSYSPREIGGVECPLRVGASLANYYGISREIALAYGNYSSQKPHLELMQSLKASINEEVKHGEQVEARIRDIFRRCCEYEYMWWDLAYRHDPAKEREIGSYF